MYTCIEAWLRRMYAAANGLTVEALVARTDTLHLTLEQVGQVINMAVAVDRDGLQRGVGHGGGAATPQVVPGRPIK